MRHYWKQALFSVLAVALIGLFVGVSLLNAAPADNDKYLEKSEKAWLGIYMQDINKDIAEALNMDVDKGVLVNGIIDDSPAQKAGLKDGDVIVRIGDNVIDNTDDLSRAVKSMEPGDKAELVVYRDGKKMDLNVVMGAAEDRIDQTFALKNKVKDKVLKSYEDALKMSMKPHGFLGVTLESLGEQLAEYFQVKEGVLITSVEKDSPAEKAGLKAGDVILSIDGKEATSPSDVSSVVREQKKGDTVDLLISRHGKEMTIAAKVEEREMNDNYYGFFSPGDNEPNIMVLPELKDFQWHNFNPDDFKFKDSEEYKNEIKEQMEELRDQLNELRDELNDLRDELN